MINLELESAALEFARKAHSGQTRKENGLPYIRHPINVAIRLKSSFPEDSALVASAYCHDVLEDCPHISEEELLRTIGREAFSIVKECTNPSKNYPDLARYERKAMDRSHIAHISEKAKYLKLADRTDNLYDASQSIRKDWVATYVKESMLLYAVLVGIDYELEINYLKALVAASKAT